MPKNWGHHEAEIRRLYMKEGRALKEVRGIMNDQYKFDASIRAYRMKFDEWGLRKNKSSKERRVRKPVLGESEARCPSSVTPLSNVDSMQLTHISSIVPFDNPPQSDEALGPADEDHAFDKLKTMLLHSLPGASFKPVLLFLQAHWSSMHLKQVEKLFLVVETPGLLPQIPPNEKSLLMKACLEADLKDQLQRDISYYNHSWLLDWWKACHTLDWDEVKTFLYRMTSLFLFGRDPAAQFLDCALVVTAERLLGYLMERLEVCRARIESLTSHESEEARQSRDAYITILDDFREKKLDVDISWYKYALQIATWNEAVASAIQNEQKRRLEEMEKDSQKYAQLRIMFKTMEAGVSNRGDVVTCAVPGKSRETAVSLPICI